MTKSKFLQGLKSALENELDVYTVQEHVQYYDRYITDEVRNGTDEAEVLAMLGDPWMIAKNILEVPGSASGSGYGSYYESDSPVEDSYYQREEQHSNVHVYRLDSGWKKWLVIALIILIIIGIISIITGIISFLAPVLVPVLVIMIVIRMLGKKK